MQPEQNTKLYRSYVLSEDAGGVLRHLGKSPRQTAFFFRNPEINFQAAQLASVFVLYGLLCASALRIEPRYRVGSTSSASHAAVHAAACACAISSRGTGRHA